MPLEPLEHPGPWKSCVSLAPHTISSEFLGYDAQGNPKFETKRSRIGEAVYQLKYAGDRSWAPKLGKVTADLIRERKFPVELVVALPPSKQRKVQPVALVAEEVAKRLGVTYDPKGLRKVKDTAELKSVAELKEREAALKGAFVASPNVKGKVVLLFDDLYRSGTSMKEATRTLLREGAAQAVYAVALTRTRSNR